MKLVSLIKQANKTYDLGLDEKSTQDLFHYMKTAGYENKVSASVTSAALDDILTISDKINNQSEVEKSTCEIYASLKQEAVAATDGCPRCKQPIKKVELVGQRQAQYCLGCNITLPIRAE